MLVRAAISFVLVAHALAKGPLHTLPEDPYAFPKYHVSYLNGLPVLNETADKWLRDGLRGGDLEFLEQPWHDEVHWDRAQKLRQIGSGDEQLTEKVRPYNDRRSSSPYSVYSVFIQKSSSPTSTYSLELMKLGPRMSYLCLIPPTLEQSQSVPQDEPPVEATLAHSWSLLQPLAGSCIYVSSLRISYGLRAFKVQSAAPSRLVHVRLLS